MNKKLSVMVMLLMIMIFLAMIMAYLAFSNGGDQKNIEELRAEDQLIKEELDKIRVKTEEWDRIINGTTEVEMETEPVTEETPPATETEEEAEEQAAAPVNTVEPLSVNATNLNLRSKPSGTGTVVRKLPNGEAVTPTGNKQQAEGYMWLEVTDTTGNKGWVAQDFLQ